MAEPLPEKVPLTGSVRVLPPVVSSEQNSQPRTRTPPPPPIHPPPYEDYDNVNLSNMEIEGMGAFALADAPLMTGSPGPMATARPVPPPRPPAPSLPSRKAIYPTLPVTPSYPPKTGSSTGPKTLQHVDFTPGCLKEGKEEWEIFAAVLEKANRWLAEMPDAEVMTCECVTWSTVDKATLYTDSTLLFKHMDGGKKTRMTRGLRLWYWTQGDRFWTNAQGLRRLGYRDYLSGKGGNVSAAVNMLNEDLNTRPVAGRILRIDTLQALQDQSSDTCVWRESLDNSRDFFMFLRMFFVQSETMQPSPPGGQIAIRDFLPHNNTRSPHDQGYERYGDVFGRAARWLFACGGSVTPINMQAIYVKHKKDVDLNTDLWEKTTWKEHGCDKKTEYLYVLRVVHMRNRQGAAPPGAAAEIPRLTYRTFTPAYLADLSGVPMDDITEHHLEDMRQNVERATWWQAASGAQVVGVETVPARWRTGGQAVAGPETCFVYNQKEKYFTREPWLHHIRLYLNGDYQDQAWSTQQPSSTGQ